MVNKGYMDADKTEAGDERYPPSYAVLPLLEFLPPRRKSDLVSI